MPIGEELGELQRIELRNCRWRYPKLSNELLLRTAQLWLVAFALDTHGVR
jgi:hypothetical protein